MSSVPELVMKFVFDVYRETGEYPTEIELPIGAWMEVHKMTERICCYEEPTEERSGAIILAQGTKIRLAPGSRGTE